MLLHTVCEEYISDLRQARLAATTRHNYIASTRRFAKSFPASTLLIEMTPDKLRRWFRLYESGHKSSTIHQAAILIRRFFDWIVIQGYLAENPVQNLDLPTRTSERERITQGQAQHLLRCCDRIAQKDKRLKVRAILSLMLFGGLRRGSVLNLKLDDLHLREGFIQLHEAKGGKEQTVYLPPEAVEALRDWLTVRPKEAPHPYVFTYNTRWKLNRQSIATLMREIYAIAEVPQPKRPCHVLRANYATRLLMNHADITQIQAALGHSRPETTLIYLRPDAEHLAKVAQKASFPTEETCQQEAPPAPQEKPPAKMPLKNEDYRRLRMTRMRQ